MSKYNIELIRDNNSLTVSSVNIALNLLNREGNPYGHNELMKKIRRLLKDMPEEFNVGNFALVDYLDEKGENRPCYHLTKDGMIYLIMKINNKTANALSIAYINTFNKMQEALSHLHFKALDKKHQLLRMENLHDLLNEEEKKIAVNYIKANTVVNKITSDIHKLPKMLKKNQMNPEMLNTRKKILDDYVKAFELTQDNSLSNDTLRVVYKKQHILN